MAHRSDCHRVHRERNITERGEKYLDGEISTYENEVDEIPENDAENGGVSSSSSSN